MCEMQAFYGSRKYYLCQDIEIYHRIVSLITDIYSCDVPSDKEILNLQGNAGNRRNGMEK
jgi:hypothetical protein